MAAKEFSDQQTFEERLPGLRKSIVVLLVFCLMPCSAPLGLIFRGLWYLRTRADIASMPAPWNGLAKVGLAVAVAEIILAIFGFWIYRDFA